MHFLNRNTQNYRLIQYGKMYIFYLELYRTSIGAIWILQFPTLLEQKAFLHPDFPIYRDFRNDVTSQWLYIHPFSLTLISFSWTYNQYWVHVSAYHGSLLFIVYTHGCHFFLNLKFKNKQLFKIYKWLESMQESNLLTIPFISGRLYRLTNRL